jgi:hypothetical protein
MKSKALLVTLAAITILASGIVAAGLGLAVQAEAAECSGYDVTAAQVAETTELAKGHSLLVVRQYSILVTDDPKDKYHLTTGECSGTILSTPDGATKASGHCARKDKGGDTYSLEWALAPGSERGTWKILAGTGKFAGKAASGWWQGVAVNGKMSVTRWGGTCE